MLLEGMEGWSVGVEGLELGECGSVGEVNDTLGVVRSFDVDVDRLEAHQLHPPPASPTGTIVACPLTEAQPRLLLDSALGCVAGPQVLPDPPLPAPHVLLLVGSALRLGCDLLGH